MKRGLRYYVPKRSNHFNQKHAENANVYSMCSPFVKVLEEECSLNETGDDSKNEVSLNTNNNLSLNSKEKGRRALECMKLMIVYCRDSRKAMDESLTLSQSVFVHEVIALYRECRSTMKYEFPSFLISILYHMFGDESASSISSKKVHCKVVIECLEEMRSIIIGSLASRMYPEHRLDVFKLIQMAIVLRGHQWFEGQCNGMNSEKLFLFVLSSASNEIRIHLQSDSKATASWKQWRFSTVDTTLNILDKLVSYIISDDE